MSLDVGIGSDVAVIFDDLEDDATYRHGGSHSVDAGASTETEAFTDESVTAVLLPISKREIAKSGGTLVEGDMRALIRVSGLTGDPARDDEIVVGSTTWRVVDWTKKGRETLWSIVVRKH